MPLVLTDWLACFSAVYSRDDAGTSVPSAPLAKTGRMPLGRGQEKRCGNEQERKWKAKETVVSNKRIRRLSPQNNARRRHRRLPRRAAFASRQLGLHLLLCGHADADGRLAGWLAGWRARYSTKRDTSVAPIGQLSARDASLAAFWQAHTPCLFRCKLVNDQDTSHGDSDRMKRHASQYAIRVRSLGAVCVWLSWLPIHPTLFFF